MAVARDRPQRLPRRTSLLPGEALLSLAERLALLNYYEPSGILHGLLLGQPRRDLLERPRLAATYARIAAHTGLEPGALYWSTAHRFAPILTLPGADVEHLALPGQEPLPLLAGEVPSHLLRADSAAQFCPECLAESPYHRLDWSLRYAAACPRHRCLLVDRCPRCLGRVSVRYVVRARCGRCYADLTVRCSAYVDDDLGIFAQQVLRAWVGTGPLPQSPSAFPLPDQSPAVLYHLVDGLLRSREKGEVPAEVQESALSPGPAFVEQGVASSARIYRLFRMAFTGIVDWPTGFYTYLAAHALRDGRRISGKLHADLGTIYTVWIEKRWQHPAFQFVHEAFDQFLVGDCAVRHTMAHMGTNQIDDDTVLLLTHITIAEAARLLRTSVLVVKRLVSLGILSYIQASPRHARRLIARSDVLRLRSDWSRALTLDEAAQWLGLAVDTVRGLVQIGLLQGDDHPHGDGGPPVAAIERQSLCLFLRRMDSITASCTGPPRTAVDLATATALLNEAGISQAGVLEHVVSGRLRAHQPVQKPGDVGALYFTEAGIQNLLASIGTQHGWVSCRELGQRMRVPRSAVRAWSSAGLLSPVFTCQDVCYFRMDEAEAFTALYVSGAQAIEILGLRPGVLPHYARQGRPRPVTARGTLGCSHYLFLREEVEQLASRDDGRVDRQPVIEGS